MGAAVINPSKSIHSEAGSAIITPPQDTLERLAYLWYLSFPIWTLTVGTRTFLCSPHPKGLNAAGNTPVFTLEAQNISIAIDKNIVTYIKNEFNLSDKDQSSDEDLGYMLDYTFHDVLTKLERIAHKKLRFAPAKESITPHMHLGIELHDVARGEKYYACLLVSLDAAKEALGAIEKYKIENNDPTDNIELPVQVCLDLVSISNKEYSELSVGDLIAVDPERNSDDRCHVIVGDRLVWQARLSETDCTIEKFLGIISPASNTLSGHPQKKNDSDGHLLHLQVGSGSLKSMEIHYLKENYSISGVILDSDIKISDGSKIIAYGEKVKLSEKNFVRVERVMKS